MNIIDTITHAIAHGFHAALRALVDVANAALPLAMPAHGFCPEKDTLCSNHWNRIYIIQAEVSRWE